MSEAVPRELKVLVERVVRPLPISHDRQKRLRSEFLAHLQAIYAEELSHGLDETEALARTAERFGDPVSLAEELRSSVTGWQRWQVIVSRVLEQQPNESAAAHLTRVLFLQTCVNALCLSGLVIAGRQGEHWQNFRVGLAALAFITVWLAGVLGFGMLVGVEWLRPKHRWWRIGGYELGLLASWPLSYLILVFSSAEFLAMFSRTNVVQMVAGGVVTMIVGSAYGLLQQRDLAYHREWAELVLD